MKSDKYKNYLSLPISGQCFISLKKKKLFYNFQIIIYYPFSIGRHPVERGIEYFSLYSGGIGEGAERYSNLSGWGSLIFSIMIFVAG